MMNKNNILIGCCCLVAAIVHVAHADPVNEVSEQASPPPPPPRRQRPCLRKSSAKKRRVLFLDEVPGNLHAKEIIKGIGSKEADPRYTDFDNMQRVNDASLSSSDDTINNTFDDLCRVMNIKENFAVAKLDPMMKGSIGSVEKTVNQFLQKMKPYELTNTGDFRALATQLEENGQGQLLRDLRSFRNNFRNNFQSDVNRICHLLGIPKAIMQSPHVDEDGRIRDFLAQIAKKSSEASIDIWTMERANDVEEVRPYTLRLLSSGECPATPPVKDVLQRIYKELLQIYKVSQDLQVLECMKRLTSSTSDQQQESRAMYETYQQRQYQ